MTFKCFCGHAEASLLEHLRHIMRTHQGPLAEAAAGAYNAMYKVTQGGIE